MLDEGSLENLGTYRMRLTCDAPGCSATTEAWDLDRDRLQKMFYNVGWRLCGSGHLCTKHAAIRGHPNSGPVDPLYEGRVKADQALRETQLAPVARLRQEYEDAVALHGGGPSAECSARWKELQAAEKAKAAPVESVAEHQGPFSVLNAKDATIARLTAELAEAKRHQEASDKQHYVDIGVMGDALKQVMAELTTLRVAHDLACVDRVRAEKERDGLQVQLNSEIVAHEAHNLEWVRERERGYFNHYKEAVERSQSAEQEVARLREALEHCWMILPVDMADPGVDVLSAKADMGRWFKVAAMVQAALAPKAPATDPARVPE